MRASRYTSWQKLKQNSTFVHPVENVIIVINIVQFLWVTSQFYHKNGTQLSSGYWVECKNVPTRESGRVEEDFVQYAPKHSFAPRPKPIA